MDLYRICVCVYCKKRDQNNNSFSYQFSIQLFSIFNFVYNVNETYDNIGFSGNKILNTYTNMYL